MQKKLLLINPARKLSSITQRSKKISFPPLGLGYVAALTPKDWEIRLIDEGLQEFRFEEADLVGFTASTQNAPRAYELARSFREKRIPTVMGGVHASTLPEEASKYVDTLVIGEAESVWKSVIHDFEAGRMQPCYVGRRIPLVNLVVPRRDLYSDKYPIKGTLQSARGCPVHCDFCSVTAFNGGTYRQRPVKEVLDELEQVDAKLIYFVDDNILGYGPGAEKRATELFRGIVDRGLKIHWGSHATINFVENEEVLKVAQKSGCFNLFIGFESLDEDCLKRMCKVPNLRVGVRNYKQIIRKFQQHGIGVIGGFMFGFDTDTKDVFSRVTEFILSSQLDAAQLSILNPLPGTRMYRKLQKEQRLLHTNYPEDWERYDNFGNVLFRPRGMTPEELEEGLLQVYKATTGKVRNVGRALTTAFRTKNLWAAGGAYLWNDILGKEFRKRYAENCGGLWRQESPVLRGVSNSTAKETRA
jgi:radical SAM superfamily enzyme YgiQ (UPF0313 family)